MATIQEAHTLGPLDNAHKLSRSAFQNAVNSIARLERLAADVKAEHDSHPTPLSTRALGYVNDALTKAQKAVKGLDAAAPDLETVEAKRREATASRDEIAARVWTGDEPPTLAEVCAKRDALDHASAVVTFWTKRVLDARNAAQRRVSTATNRSALHKWTDAERGAEAMLRAWQSPSVLASQRAFDLARIVDASSGDDRALLWIAARALLPKVDKADRKALAECLTTVFS